MVGKKMIEAPADLAERLRDIDIAILSTRAENAAIAGRPMSNNGEVDYNGASHHFALGDTHTVADIERDSQGPRLPGQGLVLCRGRGARA